MKEYLEQRIIQLKEIEMENDKKQYEYPIGSLPWRLYRELSSEFLARRNECEMTLKFLMAKERN